MSDPEILQCAAQLLVSSGMLSVYEAERALVGDSCQAIRSDGSTRRFWRLRVDGKPLCIIVAPAGGSPAELAEARSAWLIGNHLRSCAVPVPELYGWDEEKGILAFEDLGDVRLHDLAAKQKGEYFQNAEQISNLYREVLRNLANMQIVGATGFDPAWCWDTGRYDVPLMLERESGYFLRAFCHGVVGQEDTGRVEEEFQDIAVIAGSAPAEFFLHRDFQSRNIMVQEGTVRFIDFQGGRFGPLGYDLASLLIDPYTSLPLQFQEELLDQYVGIIASRCSGCEINFNKYYKFLAVQRNLQIVGAFAFLSKVRGKVFFAKFLLPALVSLRDRLEDSHFSGYRRLHNLVDQGLAVLVNH
ncbi:MAG: phosphotransferase [Desulforhopalus sp.]|nr:phosphotransferase [Desulforhopalus sp.]